jgi:hypothetical protein
MVITNSSSWSYQPYAALSYCWGGEQRQVLCRTTFKSWLSEVPYAQLPQTIKDALRVIQEIGLQYLWVDALCIIQDDLQDKHEQIARMAEIYEQAYVTISSARARTAEEGFLHSIRENLDLSQMGFKLPFRCSNGELGSVTLRTIKPGGIGWNEPLDKRGWTLQETLLFSRLLEYGTSQVRWRCRSKANLPEYVDGWTSGKLRSWNPDINWAATASGISLPVQKWKHLVSEYSTRDLKESGDKLLALSAVARKPSQLTGDEYVAGLWRRSLGELLLWHCYSNSVGFSACRYPREYRAPSWSWAAIDGTVFWQTYRRFEADVVDIWLETVPPNDLYGVITAASLTISGRCYYAVVTETSEIFRPGLNEPIPGSVWFDVNVANLKRTIWAQKLLLFQVKITDERPTGLILYEEANGQYRRVGLFQLDRSANRHGFPASNNWMERTVTIV